MVIRLPPEVPYCAPFCCVNTIATAQRVPMVMLTLTAKVASFCAFLGHVTSKWSCAVQDEPESSLSALTLFRNGFPRSGGEVMFSDWNEFCVIGNGGFRRRGIAPQPDGPWL